MANEELTLKIQERIQQLEAQRFEALSSYDTPSHALTAHHGLTGASQALRWVLTLFPADPPPAETSEEAANALSTE